MTPIDCVGWGLLVLGIVILLTGLGVYIYRMVCDWLDARPELVIRRSWWSRGSWRPRFLRRLKGSPVSGGVVVYDSLPPYGPVGVRPPEAEVMPGIEEDGVRETQEAARTAVATGLAAALGAAGDAAVIAAREAAGRLFDLDDEGRCKISYSHPDPLIVDAATEQVVVIRHDPLSDPLLEETMVAPLLYDTMEQELVRARSGDGA